MPPSHGIPLDVEAISGILGSISIACWIVVFSPQIIENFQRSSADGLSFVFIVIWSLGDVFNVVGGVLQGVLPTMIILAVYYLLADIVLLGQLFYYRGFTISDSPRKREPVATDDEDDEDEAPLLARDVSPVRYSAVRTNGNARRGSGDLPSDQLYAADGTHLSPATPLVSASRENAPAARFMKPRTALQAFFFHVTALVLVCAAGIFGWWLSTRSYHHGHQDKDSLADPEDDDLSFDVGGQVFGYLCAVFYLGSRVPQLLLNYRRQSTDGLSMLFFLFACVGNLTYVLSILAYEPSCARGLHGLKNSHHGCEPGQWSSTYGRYILLNLSWLIGSAGTLALDLIVFVQFWMYKGNTPL